MLLNLLSAEEAKKLIKKEEIAIQIAPASRIGIGELLNMDINKDPSAPIQNALIKVGAKGVYETPLGADVVAMLESKEILNAMKNQSLPIFTSCCVGWRLAAKRFVKRHLKEFPVVISFDRTLHQTIYRASDGCHLRWLSQRRLVESALKCLSFKLNPHHLALKWLERECLANSKVIIVNSQMVKNDYERFYGKAISDKCVVCYNGVNINVFYPIRKEEKQTLRKKLNLPEGHLILFVGSGFVRKGLVFLLRTLRLLPKDYKLIVLGRDKRFKKFQRLTSELDIKEIEPIYETLKGSRPSTFMDVSLGQLKSINVTLVGEVKLPGIM